MRVMFLGDSHGRTTFVQGALRWAGRHEMDALVQVGDFGYWPAWRDGPGFMKQVYKFSEESGVPFYFIDGNHEDHDALDALPDDDFAETPYGITYIRRGARWEWDGTTFGAFGGAFSIDRSRRVLGVSYYNQEMPDPSQIERLGKVDVLITHDSPVVPVPYLQSGNFKRDEMSSLSQKFVYDALVATEASLLIHGHWHCHYTSQVAGATIQGLAEDRSSLYDAAVVFDTEAQILYSIQQWEYRDE